MRSATVMVGSVVRYYGQCEMLSMMTGRYPSDL
jgi:hypothetical protein